jgi:hypothetical protein
MMSAAVARARTTTNVSASPAPGAPNTKNGSSSSSPPPAAAAAMVLRARARARARLSEGGGAIFWESKAQREASASSAQTPACNASCGKNHPNVSAAGTTERGASALVARAGQSLTRSCHESATQQESA